MVEVLALMSQSCCVVVSTLISKAPDEDGQAFVSHFSLCGGAYCTPTNVVAYCSMCALAPPPSPHSFSESPPELTQPHLLFYFVGISPPPTIATRASCSFT